MEPITKQEILKEIEKALDLYDYGITRFDFSLNLSFENDTTVSIEKNDYRFYKPKNNEE